MILRDYQSRAIDSLVRAIASGKRRPVLVSPTGSGKTVIATDIVRRAVEKGKRVLFLAPRRELILQTSETLDRSGIRHGVIMAGEPRHEWSTVQVASFDTLHARAIRTERMLLPTADVVLVDEAHLSVAKSRREILDSYPDAVIIGLTATPARGDGKGLGKIYDSMVHVATVRELMDQGHLCPAKYYAPTTPDLSEVESTKSDYVIRSLEKAVDKTHLIGDIWENWSRLARDKKTVIFCVTRKHSRHVRDEFLAHGIKAEHLDGETPAEERAAILKRVKSGETQVLCNVFVASYGLDIPSLECAVLARPTKNITLYLQTIGRVLRPAEGKAEALVIDHSGAVAQHGFADDFVPWSLDDKDVRDAKKKQEQEQKAPKEITCGECGSAFRATHHCPNCGAEVIPQTEEIPCHQEDLKEITREKSRINRTMPVAQKETFFGMLKQYALNHNYSSGWASHKYREFFGVWPNRFKNTSPTEPSQDVLNWIKSQQIRYAKRRAA